jgi:hypothetical protein
MHRGQEGIRGGGVLGVAWVIRVSRMYLRFPPATSLQQRSNYVAARNKKRGLSEAKSQNMLLFA